METQDPLAPCIKEQKLLQNFTNFTSSRAKCKKCNNTFVHTFPRDFIKHLRDDSAHQCLNYDHIIYFENYIIEKKPLWKYIKLRKDSFYECVLCKDRIVNPNTDFLSHTHEDDVYSSRGKSYEEWHWKYCQMRTNSAIICDICNQSVRIKFRPNNMRIHLEGIKCETSKINKDKRRENIMNLWRHFRRISLDKVQCKTCNGIFRYTDMWPCDSHMKKMHKHISAFEQINSCNKFNKSLKNLQKFDDLSYKCTICQQKIPDTALLNHECKEDYNVVPPYDEKWKYNLRISDFLLKCAICPSTFSCLLHKHVLRHTRGCLERNERACNIERHTDAITDTVWQHFEKESNTRAICKRCDLNSHRSFKYVYIERTLFLDHVEKEHSEIFTLETHKQLIRRWKYVKYVMGISACVLCSEVIDSRDEFDNHMHDDDFPLFMLQNYEDWPWKYCFTFYDSSVCCDICRKIIKIEYNTSDMEDHLKKMHSITLQQDVGIKDTGGSSSLAGLQQQEEGIEDAADSSFPAGTQQQDVSIEGIAGPSSIADLQQQKLRIEDTADTLSLPGTSGSLSLPKEQKKDSPSKFWRQWE